MQPLASVPATTGEAIDLLRTSVRGSVLTAVDAGYDAARRTGPAPAAHPAVVVVAESSDDIVQAVRFARAEHLSVAVRSSGYRVGTAADGAVLIVTSRLDAVTIEPTCRTAAIGAGATWAAVDAAAASHGLAPVAGEWLERCAVSDLLCGGAGWQARRHGLPVDSLVSVDLVTPDGLVVEVSADSQPEIFWAFGGAGAGSLGVVASVEIELHPRVPVYAGTLQYPVVHARAVLERWRAWTAAARPELTSSVVLCEGLVSVHGCWSGTPDTGRRLVDEWRDWLAPDTDSWVEHGSPSPTSCTDPRLAHPPTITNEWVNSLRDELLDDLVSLTSPDSGCVVEVRHFGGAVRARSGSAANSRGRTDRFLVTCAGTSQAATRFEARLAPHATGAVCLDRCDAGHRWRRAHQAFDESDWRRACAVKAALDPGDRFRHGWPLDQIPAD